MKFLKLFFLLLISLFLSCKSINVYSYLGSDKNINTVKKIIDNYSTLETYLNNETFCDTNSLKYGLKKGILSLKEHIINNKFYEGYSFEITDSIKKGYYLPKNINRERQLLDTNSYALFNFIKIRSNFNKDIIWFIFYYFKDQKIWKLNSFHYCNNYNQQAWGEDVPCDKK